MKNSVFALMFFLLTPFCFAQSTYFVNAENGLFTREAPDRGAKAITKLNYGTQVALLEQTDLNLDLIDAGQKISGRWVKISAKIPFDQIEGYVLDAYLTKDVLKPRSTIAFDKLKVTFHDIELTPVDRSQLVKTKDTVNYYVDLGTTPEDKIIKLKATDDIKKIQVYQAYETSVTIMNEGPHCDLVDWENFQSIWLPLEKIDSDILKTHTYAKKEWNSFVDVQMAAFRKAVSDYCGENYAKLVSDIKSVYEYPAAVSISKIKLKFVITDKDNNRITKVISLEIPMGC